MTEDKQLEALSEQKRAVERQILERKVRLAKESGDIVGSLERLTCEQHKKAKFKVSQPIPDSRLYSKNNKDLNIYLCEECEPIINRLRLEFRDTLGRAMAYDCPECGIVKGDFNRVGFSSDRHTWESLAGREGEHYHCRICDTQLGHCYWKFS